MTIELSKKEMQNIIGAVLVGGLLERDVQCLELVKKISLQINFDDCQERQPMKIEIGKEEAAIIITAVLALSIADKGIQCITLLKDFVNQIDPVEWLKDETTKEG